MDATQMIDDSVLESEEEEIEEEDENNRGEPLAKLRVLKNEHIPETELPLYLGDNVLGRDPNTCTLPLLAPSVSKQHTAISVSVYRGGGRRGEVVKEALVWDMGSMNGTRKGRLKLTPHVRYALSEGDRLVVADIPCQYVSCAADKMSGGGDTRPPVSRDSGERARRSDAFRVNGGDTSTDSGKCVNGGAKAPAVVSSPGQEETRKTPARTTCLSFEQTPTQPQCTLVSESDSDSDGEKGGGRARQGKALVSDSDSHMSSPTCSTFLSPTNKIIPESEDESPITPCSSTKNRPNKHVSFSKEERDVDVGRQQLKKKRAQVIVDDSEEEEGREEEERAAPGGREAEESGQDAPVKQENNVSLSGGDGSPVSTPAVSTDAVPVFNMDSDTDVEGEEEGAESVRPVTLNTTPQADQPTKPVQFHMDSDTDVDEDDDALDKVPKSVPASNDDTLLSDSLPVAQPAGTTLDSDTDVDDDADATVSDAATKATLASLQSAHTADSAPSKDFHLDSDTDVDEEEESDCRPNNMCITIDKTPSGLDLKPGGVESASAAPHNLHLDSDTDDEVIPAPVSTKLPAVVTDIEPPTAADRGAELDILSNSDTDLEEDTPLLPPVATATNVVPASAEALSVSLSTAPVTVSAALQSDSDADTDADESGVPPAGEAAAPADFRLDSDKDLEDTEAGPGEAGEGQTSGPSREKPSGVA
uniref:uncharacterized protein n=1 Tax=Centroberyx gerrardi TaxID=166262 RepID=UPI003AAED75B